jgi:type I restriction enzyme, S subunit
MADDWAIASVAELQRQGILFVEDGNHGEYRPLADEFAESGTPFIRPDDLKEGRVDFANCDRINEIALARIRKGKGRPGDIVFTHRATVGRIARIGPDDPRFVANPGVTVWRSNRPDILDPVYLYFFMQTSAFMDQVWAEAGNTDTFPYVSLTQQRSLNLSMPCIEKQRAIAHVLGTLDDKIELNRRMNETLEAMARTIFKSWFVDFDPVDAKARGRDPGLPKHIADVFPDSFEHSELGKIPARWEVKTFADTVEIIGGGTPKTSAPEYWNGDIPWFSVVDAPSKTDVWVIDTEKKITKLGLENCSTRVLPVGTTIISARGTVGRIALVGVPMAMNQSCYGLRGKVGNYGFFNYFATYELVVILQQRAHGSVFDTITRDTMNSIRIANPPRKLVEGFESLVGPMLRRVRECLLESQTYAILRDTLLPKLISGELRVKDAEKLVERSV